MHLEIISYEATANAHPTPLLFVHGAWHGAWCWETFFLPYFAEHGYNAHALSLRGHGNSPGHDRRRWLRIADYVEDVRRVAGQFETPPVIIGHSMGGYVTQKLLETFRAPAAVLVAPIPVTGFLRPMLRLIQAQPLDMLITALYPYHLIGTRERAAQKFFSANVPLERLESAFLRLHSESSLIAIETSFLTFPDPQQVKTPMLVLAAEKDRIFNVDEERATARAYDADFRLFPNMAHDMMLENDWQQVADAILDWLAQRDL